MARKEELLKLIIDAPELLSQNEIQEIFADRELCELYDNAVLLGKCGRSVPDIDTEVELEKLHAKMMMKNTPVIAKKSNLLEHFRRVAAIIGIVFGLSIAALASVIVVRGFSAVQNKKEVIEEEVAQKKSPAETADSIETESVKDGPDGFLFDNVEMQEIVVVLGRYYNVIPVFEDEEAKHVRLYLQIEKDKSIEDVVALMNNFKKVQLALADGKLIIR